MTPLSPEYGTQGLEHADRKAALRGQVPRMRKGRDAPVPYFRAYWQEIIGRRHLGAAQWPTGCGMAVYGAIL